MKAGITFLCFDNSYVITLNMLLKPLKKFKWFKIEELK